jgi:ABC-type enterochelin transport system ATPase subunit
MMIFLDEPTSGLSATDAHTVIGCLRNIANQEKTLICCVIHQVCPTAQSWLTVFGSAGFPLNSIDLMRRGRRSSLQPRYSVFEMFDHLVLVSSGGKLAYNGPTKSLQVWTSSCHAKQLGGEAFG